MYKKFLDKTKEEKAENTILCFEISNQPNTLNKEQVVPANALLSGEKQLVKMLNGVKTTNCFLSD